MAGRSNYGSLASISPACGPQNCPDLVPLKSCTNGVFRFHQSVAASAGANSRIERNAASLTEDIGKICSGLLAWGSAVGPELSYSKLPDDGEQAVVLLPEFPKAEIAVAPAVRVDTRASTAALLASTGYADQYEIPDPVAERVPAYLRPLKPIVKPIIARSRAEICDSLTDAAQSYNLPLPFFIRLLYQESGFRPGTVSPAAAK